jgi:DNA-binding transcriptional ArsR family regulator
MADHSNTHRAPDYELELELEFKTPDQYRALFEPTRLQICDLLLARAATIKELSDTLGKPRGTIGHHIGSLEAAGLVHVVRT